MDYLSSIIRKYNYYARIVHHGSTIYQIMFYPICLASHVMSDQHSSISSRLYEGHFVSLWKRINHRCLKRDKRIALTIAFWHPGTSNNWKCLNVLVLELCALAEVNNLTFEVFFLLLFLQHGALALHDVRHVLLVLVARLIITDYHWCDYHWLSLLWLSWSSLCSKQSCHIFLKLLVAPFLYFDNQGGKISPCKTWQLFSPPQHLEQ